MICAEVKAVLGNTSWKHFSEIPVFINDEIPVVDAWCFIAII